MRVRGDADAAVTTPATQFVAFADTRCIVENLQRRFEAALVISAIVNYGRAVVRFVRKIGFLNEILTPHFHLVEIQTTRDGVDGALRYVGPFRPAVAAIRVDWHCVGHHYSRDRIVVLDLVGAGAKVDRIHCGTAAGHVRQISSDIAQRFHLHAEDFAVVADRDLDSLGVRPTMGRGLVAFRTRFPPFDRKFQRACQKWTEQFLRIEVHFCAESAADIGCNDAELMLGNAHGVRNEPSVHVRHLARHINRQGSVSIRYGENRPRLHAGRDEFDCLRRVN